MVDEDDDPFEDESNKILIKNKEKLEIDQCIEMVRALHLVQNETGIWSELIVYLMLVLVDPTIRQMIYVFKSTKIVNF